MFLMDEQENTIPRFEEHELLASICRESFYEFVKAFWTTYNTNPPVWNWHIKYICKDVQEIAERVFRGENRVHDYVLNISPGTTKSAMLSIMFPAWIWTRMPSAQILCGSYSYPISVDLSSNCRNVIKSELYQKCFPYVKMREDQDSKGHFKNEQGGFRFSFGVNGTITGKHGHFIIIDDPLNPQQAASQAELKLANSWLTETIPSRKVNRAVTATFLVMQRLRQGDPTDLFLSREKVRHVCLPALKSDKVQPPELIKYYKNNQFDPVRLSASVLEEARKEMGDIAYNAQYMQDPAPPDGALFKITKIGLGIPDSPFVKIVRFWDKAASLGQGDWTVGVKMAVDKNNHFWILDVERFQLDSFKRDRRVRRVAERDGPDVVIGIEQSGGDGGKSDAQNSIKNLSGFMVHLWKVSKTTGNKEKRADPFSVQVNGGNVSMVPGSWNKEFLDELRYFPFAKHDDQVDACSGAFFFLHGKRTRRAGALN